MDIDVETLCACDHGNFAWNDETGMCTICEHPNHVGLCDAVLSPLDLMSPEERGEHARRLAERIDELEPRQRQIVLRIIEQLNGEAA